MHKKILAFVFGAALLVTMALPLFGGGTVLASQPQFDIFDMNDRFATETTGANGFARVRHTQQGSIEIAMVQVENLRASHEYELIVTISPPGPLNIIDVITSDPITTNPDGHLLIKQFDLGSFDPGDYRLDLFVTHTHSTGPDPIGVGRDLLLACEPAPVVTVE